MVKKRTIAGKFVYFINVLFALALLASYMAFYIPANVIPGFSFAGLGYPLLLLVNLAFALFWLLKLDRRVILSLAVITIGAFHLQRFYQISGQNKVVNPQKTVRVMTYNVRMFNLYKWIESAEVPSKMKDLIEAEDPQVLFLQEYYQTETTPDLNFEYTYTKMTNRGKNFGLSIMSQFPIKSTGTIAYSGDEQKENSEFIFADIEVHGKVIRFINAHLASVGLDNKDYVRIENPTEGSQEEIEKGILQIVKRLHSAFKRRAIQVEALQKAVEESKYPVILAGDFNDTPTSYTYHQVDKLLKDSFVEAGMGFSKTYVKSLLPLRIDYIFTDNKIKAFNYKVVQQELSDHYPVSVELEL